MIKLNKKYKNTWILACHKNEIKNKNDYKTIDFFGESILIYNIDNKFFAYKNVCVHRGSKIKIKKYGNEIFNCIYHGWTYNKFGNLISGPQLKNAFPKLDLKNKNLMTVKIEMCGDFIFITDNANKQNLRQFLASHFQEIEDISKKFGNLVSSEKYIWNCNWKIAIENSIDEYHGPILHKSTFKKILELKPNYTFSSFISEMNMPLQKNYMKFFSNIVTKPKFHLSNRYKHYFIFPISTIASTMDLFCYIQRYIPLDENKSKIETDIFIPDVFINEKNKTQFIIESAKKFNEIIFNEDKEICEGINQNLQNTYKFSIIGKFEKRINFFRKLIKKI